MTGTLRLLPPMRIWRLLFESTELILALHSIALGLWLALPLNTFASSATFSVMAVLAPEWAWSVVILAGGLGLMAAVVVGNVRWRLRLLLILAHLWLMVAAAMLVANYQSIAAISYVFFFAIYLRAYLRLAALNVR